MELTKTKWEFDRMEKTWKLKKKDETFRIWLSCTEEGKISFDVKLYCVGGDVFVKSCDTLEEAKTYCHKHKSWLDE